MYHIGQFKRCDLSGRVIAKINREANWRATHFPFVNGRCYFQRSMHAFIGAISALA